MQLLDRPSHNPVNDTAAPVVSHNNQITYAQLKLSLSLHLRRQIFLAVCDNFALRDHLAQQLEAELLADDRLQPGKGRTSTLPPIVTLTLNLQHPNPMAQVSQWLAQHGLEAMPPSVAIRFQIVGIEQLTRQSALVQRRFLSHLQEVEYYLPSMECSLLLWVPRPWLRSMQQSAPAFWEWHTALFEFEGDPTPIGTRSPQRPAPPPVPLSQTPSHQPPLSRKTVLDILAKDLALLDHHGSVATEVTVGIESCPTVPTEVISENATDPTPGLAPLGELARPTPLDLPKPLGNAAELVDLILAAAAQAPTANHHAEAIQLLQRIERLQLHQAPAAALAAAYHALGSLYRDLVEQGQADRAALQTAVRAYEQTLQWLDQASSQWADVLNDLGNLYWMLSRDGQEPDSQLDYLERSIQAYHLAAARTHPQTRAQTYAMIQNNLGAAYGDLARYRDPAMNLMKAVQAYEDVLQYRRPEEDASRYAATQNNLGTAYWNLAQHQQPVPCLERAIGAYQAALQYYERDREPLHYAMIQNNLGTAYWNLAQFDSARLAQVEPDATPGRLLQHAIAAYHQALAYRTLAAAPIAHAATQNNLGTAHWHLATQTKLPPEERATHLQQAVTAYTTALSVVETVDPHLLNFDQVATHNNLGSAYYHLATNQQDGLSPDQRLRYLEFALEQHLWAWKAWQGQASLQETAFQAIVQTVRACYSQGGIEGQNVAISRLPALLLPEIMRRL